MKRKEMVRRLEEDSHIGIANWKVFKFKKKFGIGLDLRGLTLWL